MASISGVSSSGLQFTGLATGIDSTKIIDSLTKINQNRIDQFTSQQDTITTKQTSFVALQARLFDLQSRSNNLARSAGGSFDSRIATTSDTSALTASAGTSAIPGNYTVTVGSLSQTHQIMSAGFLDPNAAIKTGTLDIKVGTGTTSTITIDDRNATLQGLVDAVNNSNGDVKATIVQDGSATPYRLMLTSTKAGAANTISLTNNLTGGSGAAINPAASTLQEAADASITLGSGAGAITIHSTSNQLTNVIPGVSINLLQANTSKPIALTISNDTANMTKAVQDFVDGYNSVQDFLQTQTKFDPASQTTGTLFGNRDIQNLTNDLSNALTTAIPGLSSSANRLSSVGLSFDDSGKLVLDSSKLSQSLSGQSGASISDIKKLFAISGTSDNPGITFAIGTNKTKPTEGVPYQAVVTAPATQAKATATNALAASTVIDSSNQTFTFKLNGVTSSPITLDAGTYTPEQLAAQLQQKINSSSTLNGNTVAVSLDNNGKLQVTSQQYGESSKIAFSGGTALGATGPLGFDGTETATGSNVVGHFVVNGQTEAATGSGQYLIGNSANSHTSGMQVKSTLTTAGTASLTVNQGFASRLNQMINKYIDADNGRFKSINDDYKKSLKDIDTQITKQNTLLDEKKNSLLAQFAAMETAVNNLKGIQTQLTSMFASTKA